MAHLTISVEYGIHSLLWLVGSEGHFSSRDLAQLQGISSTFLAKIFPKLEKAGIVSASEGVRGGYRLARPAEDITFLEIVDAIEGKKPLFDCQEIRGRCALFRGTPPAWSIGRVCAIHAVMLQAEKSMRDTLARQSLADVHATFHSKAPREFTRQVQAWMSDRLSARRPGRTARASGPPD
jgi:Rrf2 family protein